MHDDGDSGSWTSETLPLSVRKELLERELKKLGFRDIRIEPFEEADGVLEPGYRSWRFPWTVISARR